MCVGLGERTGSQAPALAPLAPRPATTGLSFLMRVKEAAFA